MRLSKTQNERGKTIVQTRRMLLGTAAAIALAGAVVALRAQGKPVEDPTGDFTDHGFVRRTLETPTGTMAYYERGQDEGRPLIFLHAICGGASSWQWSKVAPAFLNEYRVILPDWVGWGSSKHPSRFLLFEDYVAQLQTLVREVVGQPAVVVASGLAAGFAAEVAQEAPEHFAAMIMAVPTGGMDFGEDDFEPLARNTITPIARRNPINKILYRLVFHRRGAIRSWFTSGGGYYDNKALSAEVVDAWTWSARKPGAEYSVLPFFTGELRYDFAPYLENLKIPAVTIWGEKEETSPGPEVRDRLVALNPDIPMVLVPRARVNFELELPAQTIALISEWTERLYLKGDPENATAKDERRREAD